MTLFSFGNLKGDLLSKVPRANKGVSHGMEIAVEYGEANQAWDQNTSLQPAHDLWEIQNFMLHLRAGTRIKFD